MPKYLFQIDTGTTKLTPATLIAAIHGFFGITAIIKDMAPCVLCGDIHPEESNGTGKEETANTSDKGSSTITTQ